MSAFQGLPTAMFELFADQQAALAAGRESPHECTG